MWDGWGPGSYGGTNVIGFIFMMVFMVAIIVGIILLVIWLVRQTAGGVAAPGPGPTAGGESALDILRKRYANGEIDKAEFEEKKKALTG